MNITPLQNTPAVYALGTHTCIVLGALAGEVGLITCETLEFEVRRVEAFIAEGWALKDYPVQRAAEKYLSFRQHKPMTPASDQS